MLESLQRKQVPCVTREINNQADRVALPPQSLKAASFATAPPTWNWHQGTLKVALGRNK